MFFEPSSDFWRLLCQKIKTTLRLSVILDYASMKPQTGTKAVFTEDQSLWTLEQKAVITFFLNMEGK